MYSYFAWVYDAESDISIPEGTEIGGTNDKGLKLKNSINLKLLPRKNLKRGFPCSA